MLTETVPFEQLSKADLVVDREYEGGHPRTSAGDPLARLLPCGNLGGFRIRRRKDGHYLFAALYTSGDDPDWPDTLDTETGVFTYYGDNKTAGRGLEDTPRGGSTPQLCLPCLSRTAS